MNAFIETAAARETSPEIMEAILYVAGGDEQRADEIWADPANVLHHIIERVTKNGLIDASDFCFGAAGHNWAVQ
jgi:hypothetical protein